MSFLLIIPILAAGFIACQIDPVEKLKHDRYEGQYLYLTCLKKGIICFFFAFSLIPLFLFMPNHMSFCGYVIRLDFINLLGSHLKKNVGDVANLQGYLYLLLLSLMTLITPFFLNEFHWYRLSKRFKSSDRDFLKLCITLDLLDDSPIDSMLFELSIDDNERFAMLSMADRKVYVAKVVRAAEPAMNKYGGDQEVLIEPLMSGYRHKDTLQVVFTTYYERINKGALLKIEWVN